MRRVEFEIIEDRYEEGQPTYLILKSTYRFGFHWIGEIYGVDGTLEPFEDFKIAEDELRKLEGKIKK